MNINERVLQMNMNNLSEADLKWLHDLRNKALVLQGRFQLKEAKLELYDNSPTKDVTEL